MLPIVKKLIEENIDLIRSYKFHELFDLFDTDKPSLTSDVRIQQLLFHTLQEAGFNLTLFRAERLKMICDHIVQKALQTGDGESLHSILRDADKNWHLFSALELHNYIIDHADDYNIKLRESDPTFYWTPNFKIWRNS